MQNLNYLFNKEYYKNLGTPVFSDDVKKLNQKINNVVFRESDYRKPLMECNTVHMKIRYPGLLIGTGNPHEFGMRNINWEEEITVFNDDDRIELSQDLKNITDKFLSEPFYFQVIKKLIKNALPSDRANIGISVSDIEDIRNNVIERGTVRNTVFDKNKQAFDFLMNLISVSFASDDDVKNGFSLDYTTGQPYIPGSSVKGMLRSYFKEHGNVVAEILKAETQKEWTAEDVGILEEDIFVNHDVFFDAVIYWGDKYGNILSMDFITPHQSSLKNPIPIRILKINPGVKLEFRFQLYDHAVGDKWIDKNKLMNLFGELLQLFGVGAKTNVGYGIMEKTDQTRDAYRPSAPAAVQNSPTHRENDYANRGNRENNRGDNRGNNRGNNRDTRPAPVSAAASPVKIICPHCGKPTYKFQQDGKTLNTECKNKDCRKSLL